MTSYNRFEATQFPVVTSKLNKRSAEFITNKEAWIPILEKYEDSLSIANSQGSQRAIEKYLAKGQLLARDRVALLLDTDSPFLEIACFAGHELQDSTASASLVSGIGLVSGVICLILAHIPSINGGAWNEFTVLKQNRVTQIASENNLPLIALVQSAGVFLPQQFRVFHKGGQIFRDLSIRTANGQSSCAVVFGSSTAGGAYHPALSDYTVFVKDQAQVFLGGPPLVKMATGEIADAEELGGAYMHSTVTGLCDELASDEFDAIRKAREWILTTPSAQKYSSRLSIHDSEATEILSPRNDIEDIFGIINPDIGVQYDMMEVIIRIVDDSRIELFKPMFGKGMITAWAKIHGHLTGIIANKMSVINSDEADKATQFIRLCNQKLTPIVFLHNVTGFMVGLKTEREGLIKKGAQFVSAVSTSSVPHISIICGASYGAGNYAMCGRAYQPRFLFAWPICRCSVMGPDQLSGVMEQITRKSAENSGNPISEPKLKASVDVFRQQVLRDSMAYSTSAHILDDGIINPRDTRDILGMCLEVVNTDPIRGNPGARGLARM